jgi:hypothetical protein
MVVSTNNATSPRPAAPSAAPLKWSACFELPEPEDFRPNDLRELELTEDEINALLRVGCAAKYQAAYERWYKWRISHRAQPKAYSAKQIRQWFDHAAEKQLGRPFVVDAHNEAILDLLCHYFAEDPAFETETDLAGRNYSLQKGLLLRGGVGCGKTTLLSIFASNPRQPYLVVPARELVSEYTARGTQRLEPAGGLEALEPYLGMVKLPIGNEQAYNFRTHAGLALDDIGTEDYQAKHYGAELAVVEHVVSSRDDKVTAGTVPRWATHATTNIDFDNVTLEGKTYLGLEARYGTRWRSRVRGLMNIIDFPDTAPDRRG